MNDNISPHVQNYYNRKQLDTWVDVCHVITTNIDYDPKRLIQSNMPAFTMRQVSGKQRNYMGKEDKLLKESGYSYFLQCPLGDNRRRRYGTECPAWWRWRRYQAVNGKAIQALEKKINPPNDSAEFCEEQ